MHEKAALGIDTLWIRPLIMFEPWVLECNKLKVQWWLSLGRNTMWTRPLLTFAPRALNTTLTRHSSGINTMRTRSLMKQKAVLIMIYFPTHTLVGNLTMDSSYMMPSRSIICKRFVTFRTRKLFGHNSWMSGCGVMQWTTKTQNWVPWSIISPNGIMVHAVCLLLSACIMWYSHRIVIKATIISWNHKKTGSNLLVLTSDLSW